MQVFSIRRAFWPLKVHSQGRRKAFKAVSHKITRCCLDLQSVHDRDSVCNEHFPTIYEGHTFGLYLVYTQVCLYINTLEKKYLKNYATFAKQQFTQILWCFCCLLFSHNLQQRQAHLHQCSKAGYDLVLSHTNFSLFKESHFDEMQPLLYHVSICCSTSVSATYAVMYSVRAGITVSFTTAFWERLCPGTTNDVVGGSAPEIWNHKEKWLLAHALFTVIERYELEFPGSACNRKYWFY